MDFEDVFGHDEGPSRPGKVTPSMLRTILHVVVGIPVMVGLYFFCRWLTTGISIEFGEGVFTGTFLTLGLLWTVWKLDPRAFYGEDSEL
jgi:hypothetical protein